MGKPRVTATDRLADVIEVVELGRSTGLLTVERGDGSLLEEGSIYFWQGRAAYAAVESLRGQDALAVLGGWGRCRFAFDSAAPRPAPNISLQSAAQSAAPTTTTSGPITYERGGGPPTGYFPSNPSQAPSRGLSRNWPTPPNQPSPAPQTPYSNPSRLPGASPASPSSAPSSSFGSSTPGSWSGSLPGVPNGMTSSYPSIPASGRGPDGSSSQSGWQPALPSTSSSLSMNSMNSLRGSALPISDADLLRRPRRAPDVRDLMSVVNAYQLSRGHRTLLLLADGEHSVIDLARLSSKQIEEVFGLLRDLEGHGLIYYY